MKSIRDRIGLIIREKRIICRFTQEELAEKVSLSTGMIGQIERGETMPSIDSLASIIRELNIDPRSLFDDDSIPDSDLSELNYLITTMDLDKRQLLLKIARIIRDN